MIGAKRAVAFARLIAGGRGNNPLLDDAQHG